MKLSLLDISIEKRVLLQELVKNTRQQGTYLSAYTQNFPKPNTFLIILCVIYIFILILAQSWSLYYWLLISGPILTFFIFRQIQLIWYWKLLSKDSVFFDSQFFISLQNQTLYFIPLTEFKYTDIVINGNGGGYLVRFHFNSFSIMQSCKTQTSEKVLRFQQLLQKYTSSLQQSNPDLQFNTEIKISFGDKIKYRKSALIFSSFITILLLFALPRIIDTNAFNNSFNINTPTSFRTYLAENRNVIYRDDARSHIKQIYNHYISKYRNSLNSSTYGSNAFIETLKYLRDKDLFKVNLKFISSSYLEDYYSWNKEYKVIPIAQSFSDDKNIMRENEVLKTIQSSFGNIFPTDVFTISESDDYLLPKFEVYYSYKNNVNSIYYRVEESHLPDNMKTWYYGIEIEWYFGITLPNAENSIYEFSLKSYPAERFSSESFDPDAVYTNMAISAFRDFKDEFYKQFLQ